MTIIFASFRHDVQPPVKENSMKKDVDSAEEQPEYDFSLGKRGSVLTHTGKTRITIWIDNDVLHHFRDEADAAGRGYQTVINAVLRDHIRRDNITIEPRIEDGVRRALSKISIAVVETDRAVHHLTEENTPHFTTIEASRRSIGKRSVVKMFRDYRHPANKTSSPFPTKPI